MNLLTGIGLILVGLGLSILVFTSFTYHTQERVVDLGPLKVNKEKTHTISFSPWAGGACLAAGAFLVFTGSRKP